MASLYELDQRRRSLPFLQRPVAPPNPAQLGMVGRGSLAGINRSLVPQAPTQRFDPAAALQVTQTPKSASQNVFLNAIQGKTASTAAAKNNALTKFVQEAYAQQAPNKSALDQERSFLDKIFATNGGLVDELANARAKRQAGVLMRVKMAMDKAGRSNNVRRMFSGNNSYNDRAYQNTLAGIAANEAIGGAERESDDLRYLTGVRSGALGARGRLSRDFTDSLLDPARGTNAALRDDASVLQSIADLEDRNSIYETPLEQLRREIAMRNGLSELDGLRDDSGVDNFSQFGEYTAPAAPPLPYPPANRFANFGLNGRRFQLANTPRY